MTILLLDTSGYVAFKRNDPQALLPIQQAQEILLPVVTVGELLGGFAFGSKEEQNRRELMAFQTAHRTRVLAVTETTAHHYAQIYAYLRSIGRPIPTNDMWIAASALEHNARLLSADSHFAHIPLLLTEYIQR